MHQDFPNISSLSATSIALRVLPAIVVFLMLLIGPPEAWRTGAAHIQKTATAALAPTTTPAPPR